MYHLLFSVYCESLEEERRIIRLLLVIFATGWFQRRWWYSIFQYSKFSHPRYYQHHIQVDGETVESDGCSSNGSKTVKLLQYN